MPTPDYPFIDLREELKDLLGKTFNWLGLRQLDYSKKCSCTSISKVGGTSLPDKSCKRCMGMGFKFTDYLVRGYTWIGAPGVEFPGGPGLVVTQTKQLILQHNRTVNKFDFALLLDQEPDSKIRSPFKIMRQFCIQDVIPIRADNSRIEFWKCFLEERTVNDYRPGEEGTNFTYPGNRINDPSI